MNTGSHALMSVLATATTQHLFGDLWGGLLAILPVAALGLYGWMNGIFRAIIAGLQILAAFVIALACCRPMAFRFEMFGCPSGYSLALAFWLVFTLCLVAIGVAVAWGVREDAVRFETLLDHGVGLILGAVAGVVLGGALLVGWSLTNGPQWMRFNAQNLPLDGGKIVLHTFARWVAADHERAGRLEHGDRWTGSREHGGTGGPSGDKPVILSSEPFVDANENAVCDEPEEHFHDLNQDGKFTLATSFVDQDSDKRRTIGLLDCYLLSDWNRVRCEHAPRIVSVVPDPITIKEKEPFRCEIKAEDADPNDGLTFQCDLDPKHGNISAAIDPTGMMTVILDTSLDSEEFEKRDREAVHRVTVMAIDKSGQKAVQTVNIRVPDKH